MLDNILKGFEMGIGILLAFGIIFGIVYATGFHSANEIVNGVFQGSYTFNGSVNFTDANITGVPSGSGTFSITQGIGGLDSYTVFLLKSNTTDGSTTFVDSSSSGHSITANGDVHHEVDAQKFGTTSIDLDGTGDYFTVPDNADWNFGSGDFTIDFWINFTTVPAVGANILWEQWDGGGQAFQIFYHDGTSIIFTAYSGASNLAGYSYAWTPNTSQWYHLALVRSGSNVYIFIDGISQSLSVSTAIGSNSLNDLTQPVSIGARRDNTYHINGYYDEIRVSKGIARWTTDFTPPTQPYDTGGTLQYTSSEGTNYTLTTS